MKNIVQNIAHPFLFWILLGLLLNLSSGVLFSQTVAPRTDNSKYDVEEYISSRVLNISILDGEEIIECRETLEVLRFNDPCGSTATLNPSVYIDPSLTDLEVDQTNSTSDEVFQLFSHGRPGELLIHNSWLDAKGIVGFITTQIHQKGLTVSHINIYGCNFAKNEIGREAVKFIEDELLVSVSASNNITGKEGDWDLEVGQSIASIRILDYPFSLQAASATYNSGDIPTGERSWPGDCTASTLQVNIPMGAEVTGVDVSYSMTAQNGGEKDDQRSQIYYVEGATDEGGYSSGFGNRSGIQTYNRTGLSLANGVSATGILSFEMHAYRTNKNWGCNTYFNKVDNNTWTITVYYTISVVDPCIDPAGTDTDGDGVNDYCDLDDDNDGILDADEFACISSVLNWEDYFVEGTSGTTGEDPTVTTASPPLLFNGVTLNIERTTNTTGDWKINNNYFSYAYNWLQASIIGGQSVHTFSFSRAVNDLSYTLYDIDVGSNFQDELTIDIISEGISYVLTPLDYTLGANVSYTGSNTFLGQGNNENLIFHITVPVNSMTVYYKQVGTNPSYNQGSGIGDFSFCVPADTDNDDIPDYRDTDSDNDGCPDAIEGSGSFLSFDLTNDRLTGADADNDGVIDGITTQGVGTSQDASVLGVGCVDLCASSDLSTLVTLSSDSICLGSSFIMSVINSGGYFAALSGTNSTTVTDNSNDPNEVSSSITLPSGVWSDVSDITLTIDADHTWVGDIACELVSPCGSTYIFNTSAFSSDLVLGNIYNFNSAYTGSFPNAGVNGDIVGGDFKTLFTGVTWPCAAVGGDWTLSLSTINGGHNRTLTLNSWSINIVPHAQVTGSGTIGDLIYSGPNSDAFEVEITPPATAGTYVYDLEVYDDNGCSVTEIVSVEVIDPVIASVNISSSPSGSITSGTEVNFTASPTNGGLSPSYQWKVNGSDVGLDANTFSSTTLNDGDVVTCVMTSNHICVSNITASSNDITINIQTSLTTTSVVIIDNIVKPDKIHVGEDVCITFDVHNLGPDATINPVTWTFELPAELEFVSTSFVPSCTEVGGSVSATTGVLALGATVSYQMCVRLVPSITCPGSYVEEVGAKSCVDVQGRFLITGGPELSSGYLHFQRWNEWGTGGNEDDNAAGSMKNNFTASDDSPTSLCGNNQGTAPSLADVDVYYDDDDEISSYNSLVHSDSSVSRSRITWAWSGILVPDENNQFNFCGENIDDSWAAWITNDFDPTNGESFDFSTANIIDEYNGWSGIGTNIGANIDLKCGIPYGFRLIVSSRNQCSDGSPGGYDHIGFGLSGSGCTHNWKAFISEPISIPLSMQFECDTDGDGIDDVYDIDDDDDGIPDDTEGTGDTDGDGVLDRYDLDSDNDGIYDHIEAGGLAIYDADNNGAIDNVSATDENLNGLFDLYDIYCNLQSYSGNGLQVISSTSSIGYPLRCRYAQDGLFTRLNANNDELIMVLDGVVPVGENIVIRHYSLSGTSSFSVAQSNDGSTFVNLQSLGTSSGSYITTNYTVAGEIARYIRIRNTDGSSNNDAAIDALSYTFNQDLCPLNDGVPIEDDSDNDGTLDTYELDSDDDGCKDVLEAGMQDGDDDGLLGIAAVSISVDTVGRVINDDDGPFSIGTTSYVTPNDLDSNSVYDFKQYSIFVTLIDQPTDQVVELSNDATFTVNATADSFLWQVDQGAGWADLSNGGIYSGVNTNTLFLTNPSLAMDNVLFRVKLSSEALICSDDTVSNAVVLHVWDGLGFRITGKVFQDTTNNNKVDGVSKSFIASDRLYIVLSDTIANVVLKSGPVVNGLYKFYGITSGMYVGMQLSDMYYSPGDTMPDEALPLGWIYAGEIQNDVANSITGNDGEVDGKYFIPNITSDEDFINFSMMEAYYTDNGLACPSDSIFSICNPTAPQDTASYTTGIDWVLTDSSNDYPGVVTNVGCDYSRTVSFWGEWKYYGLYGAFKDTCEQVFTYVFDTVPPTFTVPANDTVYKDMSCSFDASITITGDVSDEADSCSAGLDAVFSDDSTGLTGPSNTGIMLREWSLTDDCGNTTVWYQSITVLDTIAPWATSCPINVNDVLDRFYDPENPVFEDNCGVETVTWAMTGATTATGNAYVAFYDFMEGVTTLTYTATDSSGNWGNCSFDITVLDPCDALTSGNTDTDGDGISDICDLDDDNDGILDIDENLCRDTLFFEDFGIAPNTNPILSTSFPDYDTDVTTDFTYRLVTDPYSNSINDNYYSIFHSIPESGNWAASAWQTIGDHTVGSATPTLDRMLMVNAGNTLGVIYQKILTGITAGAHLQVSFWGLNLIGDGSDRTKPNLKIELFQNDILLGNGFTGEFPEKLQGDTDAWQEYSSGPFIVGDTSAITIIFTNIVSETNANDLALDDILVIQYCDTDNDTIPDYLDTDSDNDGCPDATEGADHLSTTATLVGGSNGGSSENLGIDVDTEGIPIVASGGQASTLAVIDPNMNICNGSDYGDAPALYDADSAASHTIQTVPLLYLGAVAPDNENAAQSSLGVDDDNTDTDDEDAFDFFPPYTIMRSNYTLHVPITNTSGDSVTVAAWIDMNSNGSFDLSERASITVASGVDTATLVWESLPLLSDDVSTYIRLRIASDKSELVSANSRASDGEVEDYSFEILYAGACPTEAFLVQDAVSNWYDVNLATASYELANDNHGGTLNGVGFNVLDGLIYGYDTSTKDGSIAITSVNSTTSPSTYTTYLVGPIAGLPINKGFYVGDVGAGNLYLRQGGQDSMYIINVDPNSPDYLSEAIALKITGVGGSYTDMVYLPSNDTLYCIENNSGNLHKIDPISGETFNVADTVVPAATYGAQYLDVNGFMYASDNATGDIYRVSLTGNSNYQGVLWAHGPSSGQNDGSRCPLAPVPIDFGDAPASYITEISVGNQIGARHAVPQYNEATYSAPLMLGEHIDIEIDGVPSDGADADDINGFDDEDGLIATTALTLASSSFSATISVLNNTGHAAFVSAYVDFDGNGLFDADERADASVLLSSASQQVKVLSWSGLNATVDVVAGMTYMRFRLSSIETDVLRPDSIAIDGEVEDYLIYINEIHTDSVTQIRETIATLYGTAVMGDSIVEFGFYYSTDTASSTLVSANVNTTEVITYNGAPISLSDSSYSSDVTYLNTRAAYYFRAYMKNASGVYSYGEKVRFISEKRDFSLALDDAGDCLVIDEESTDSVINNWEAGAFSLEFWMKKGNANTNKQVILSNTSAIAGYLVSLTNGNVALESKSGGSVFSTVKVEDQEWHYIGISYNGSSVVIYVDDSASAALPLVINKPVGNNCFIGSGYSGTALEYAFIGHLDAMRFWNVALIQSQVSELLYDVIHEGDVFNTIEGQGSGKIIPGLAWENLTASLGFNVKSTQEEDTPFPVSFLYEDQTQLHQFPFFHNDARLADDKVAFNVVAIGGAHPSPYLPRVYWRYNSTENVWLNSDNWGGYAFPGEGATVLAFPDVTSVDLLNDSAYCLYTVVDSSSNSPRITVTPPEVQVLIDRHDSIGTYAIDENASELTVLKGIYHEIFDVVVDNEDGAIVIEEGSFEVH